MLFQLFDCEEQALFLRAPGLGVEYKIHIAGSEIRDMMNRPGQNVLGIVIVARTEVLEELSRQNRADTELSALLQYFPERRESLARSLPVLPRICPPDATQRAPRCKINLRINAKFFKFVRLISPRST